MKTFNVKAEPVRDDKIRTPNPDCPSCQAGSLHTEEHWRKFHPDAGHGFSAGQGWSKEGMQQTR